MELAILANKASVAGADATIRKSAGFAAWITTNDQRSVGGADGGFGNPTPGLVACGNQRDHLNGRLLSRSWIARSFLPIRQVAVQRS